MLSILKSPRTVVRGRQLVADQGTERRQPSPIEQNIVRSKNRPRLPATNDVAILARVDLIRLRMLYKNAENPVHKNTKINISTANVFSRHSECLGNLKPVYREQPLLAGCGRILPSLIVQHDANVQTRKPRLDVTEKAPEHRCLVRKANGKVRQTGDDQPAWVQLAGSITDQGA